MYLRVGEEREEGGWRRGVARERGIECIVYCMDTVSVLKFVCQE
jgi:hypothetical protein